MRIAMIGMGAVGSVFGMDLYNAYPNDFFAIASGSRYDRLQAEGLQVNDARYPLRVERPAEDVVPAEVIFVCVKNYGLADALDDMRPFVGDGTIIVPLLNGISATPTLRAAFPQARVLFGIAMGIDARLMRLILPRAAYCSLVGSAIRSLMRRRLSGYARF